MLLQLEYEQALALQSEKASVQAEWLFFSCPPTITLGKRAHFSEVLTPMDDLKRRGIRLLPVDRGGQVTYHGPGQILGFPCGSLLQHTGDSRGVKKFLCQLQKSLVQFIQEEGEIQKNQEVYFDKHNTGIWILEEGVRKKIVSFGMYFKQKKISHGFALNVHSGVIKDAFELIIPCGHIGSKPGYMFSHPVDENLICQKLSKHLEQIPKQSRDCS